MERKSINPWKWQDQFGFVQANELTGAKRMLLLSGQASVDAKGRPVHVGNMAKQIAQALDNVETVVEQAGYSLSDVMRLTIYTTNVGEFLSCYEGFIGRLTAARCRFSSTLIGVASLAFPELLVEIEATAVAD